MPHDANGNVLKVGDEVLLRAVVEDVQAHAEWCNCSIRTFYPMYPSDRRDLYTLSTRQLELVNKPAITGEENKPLGWVDTKNPQFV